MAKGGSRGRRSYTRDARGRFASTPGGGAKPKPPRTSFRQRQAVSLARSRGQTGRLGSATKAAKARLKATRARTGAGASPQQKAALTRAKRMAAALAGERRVKTTQKAGVVKGRVKRDPGVGARLAAAAKPVTPIKPVASTRSTTKSKRQTKQQRAAAYVDRIKQIGEGRTGVKAERAARVRRAAEMFATGLAGFHKRTKAKTREDLMKGLSEAYGNQGRTRKYSAFIRGIPGRSRPQSGKASFVRPGQIKRGQARLSNIDAATRAPFSKWNPNPARQNPIINARSKQIAARASAWYRGERPVGGAKPLPKPIQYTPIKREGVKATERQRARRQTAEGRYGIKHTRNSMRFGIKGKRTMAQIKRTATRRMFKRLEDVKGTKFVGSTARGSIYRFPVNQQYNIFGGVDRVRAPRGRKIGTRKPGSRKIEPIKRRRG